MQTRLRARGRRGVGAAGRVAVVLAAAILAAGVVRSPGATAQEDGRESAAALQADRRVELSREIEALRETIAERRAREGALDATVDALDRDMDALSRELVSTGRRIAEIEARVAESEERLQRLAEDETWLTRALAEREDRVAAVLSALQRIGRNPPPAIVARPDDALASVRGAMLLNAVLPDLAVEAEAVAADLEALAGLRRETEAEWRALERSLAALAETRGDLEALIAEKRRARRAAEDDLAGLRRETARLALRARDLGELVGDVAGDGPDGPGEVGAGEPGAGERTLLSPGVGRVVREFGEEDATGTPATGRSIATIPGGTVVAPADGRVVYAGPFRSYGTILLLDVGDPYHVLLAGMQRLDVEVGDTVSAGEPVARMGLDRVASAIAIDLASSGPILYVEVRRNGEPIDPRDWWAGAALGEVSE